MNFILIIESECSILEKQSTKFDLAHKAQASGDYVWRSLNNVKLTEVKLKYL